MFQIEEPEININKVDNEKVDSRLKSDDGYNPNSVKIILQNECKYD